MALVNPSASPAIPGVTSLASVSLFSDVRALAAGQYPLVWVLGGTVVGDGKDGVFYWSSSSLTADDGLTVLAPNAGGTGRWIRLYSGFSLSSGASHVSTVQSGTGAVSTDIQTHLRSYAINAKTFAGCVADGITDDTTAFSAALSAAIAAGKALYIPTGTYKITSTLPTITGQIVIFGDGMFKSLVKFAPTAADTLFYLDNGASKVTHVSMRDLGLYSTDTTYAKVGIDGRDLSVCSFERIYIRGTGMASGPGAGAGWSDSGTSGSIGIRFQGRESVTVSCVEIIADKPIYFAANPNSGGAGISDPNAGEDCDHFHFEDLYLVGNGNYLVELAAGLGASELVFDGYQAWVGGTGGFKINDTRVGPTITSRGIKFKNIRVEQITDSAGYAFNMVFTAPVLTMKLENVLMAATSNGITINGCQRLVLDQVIAGQTSGTSLVTAGMTSSSVLTMRNCNWTTGGAVTLTGLTQITAEAYRSASYAAPSDAVYAGQITDTRINVEKVTITAVPTATGIQVGSTTGDVYQVNPLAAGNGVLRRALNNSVNDYSQLSDTFSTWNWNARTGALATTSAGTVDSTGIKPAIRFQEKQGAVLTAANNLTLGTDGNYFQVDGATQINLILNTNWQGGSLVTLKFNSNPLVKHNQAASGNNKPIFFKSGADFTAAAGATKQFRYDATDATWYEV